MTRIIPKNIFPRLLLIVSLALSALAVPTFVFAQGQSSLFIVNHSDCGYSIPNYGNGLGRCPEGVSAVGGMNVSPKRSCGNEVNGSDFNFTRKNALVASGWMTLCSTFVYKQDTPTEAPNDTVLIIAESEGSPPNYGNGFGNCPANLVQRGFFRVENQLGNSQSATDYKRNTRQNATLALCAPPQANATLLIWSNDCGQIPETNYTEACYGINAGGFHVGLGPSACSENNIYGVSASGKQIKSGWMYLCLNQSYRPKPVIISPAYSPLETRFEDESTPLDGKAFNINDQDWYVVNTSSWRSDGVFTDYFNFYDVETQINCKSIFSQYIHEIAYSGVMQGFPKGDATSNYLNQNFSCWGAVSRADASVFLVRALNMTINTAGGPHFSDVPPTHPAYAAVETLYNAGATTGCAPGIFCENHAITRGTMAVWIAKALALPDVNLPTPQTYCDVPNTRTIDYSAIENITARVIAIGEYSASCPSCGGETGDHCFLPDQPLTREMETKFLIGASRKCFAEVNLTNYTMELGVDAYCTKEFNGISLPPGKNLVEYDYKVWTGNILGNWYESPSRKVFFYTPSCIISANPSQIEKAGSSNIKVDYVLGTQPSPAEIACGDGSTETAQCSGAPSGSCTATCDYEEPADYPITYSVTASFTNPDEGAIQCTPASVTIKRQLPQVNFLDARCPMELVAVDEAKVYVELVQDGKRQCDSQITLNIKITSLNGVVTNEHYPKMGEYPACDEASKLNWFSVNTITDGLYEVTAGRTGFETSKCNFRVFHQRAASIPELNPIALLAVFALAFAFLRARRLHGARGN